MHLIAALVGWLVDLLARFRSTADGTAPAGYVGRHGEDTVEIVTADWRPPIGRRRIALLTDTQPMDAVTNDEVGR
ncbi:hypothetical protein ACIBF5_29730 [Micromonospora sp. NPDC050417]|uniref:hypothetical protein n=1 Tax=Micromonospora sp. NPDC050417 TaxID=3364280 RepID=UPI0037A513FE